MFNIGFTEMILILLIAFVIVGPQDLPRVALYLTTKAGLTDHRMLADKRKFVLLGIFVIAAILTPPDIVSQIALGVPLYLLYEVSIQVARLTRRS